MFFWPLKILMVIISMIFMKMSFPEIDVNPERCTNTLLGLISPCAPATQIQYPEYTVTENTALGCAEVCYDGIAFRPFGVFNDSKLKGKQIGVREDSPSIKIHEVIGYDSKEWVVEYHDVFMGGNMILKAAEITNIPPELAQYREYDF
jgi:hypothetical protein